MFQIQENESTTYDSGSRVTVKEFWPARLYSLAPVHWRFWAAIYAQLYFRLQAGLVGVIAAPLFFSFAVILLEIRCSAITWSSYSQALLSVRQRANIWL